MLVRINKDLKFYMKDVTHHTEAMAAHLQTIAPHKEDIAARMENATDIADGTQSHMAPSQHAWRL